MVKTLRKKFIITSMAAVTVLLAVLLGAQNAANYVFSSNQSTAMLEMFSRNEGAFKPGQMKPDKRPFPELFGGGPISEDNAMSARFFLVRTDLDGNVIFADTARISSVTEAEAKDYAAEALSSGKSDGKIRNFIYKTSISRNGTENVTVFLDISNQIRSFFSTLAISLLAGLICWGLMLLLVLLLSKKAIQPVAESFEKQKRFVTDAGHELKTPLAIILANTEALELHSGETKWSANIRAQVKRLNGLMQNLLTLSKMEENALQLDFADTDLTAAVGEGLEPFAEPAERKGIKISSEIEQGVSCRLNKEAFLQLVSILLDNAVKYSVKDGEIFVKLTKTDKNVLFSVQNSCDSLPECGPDKLFDRFYRSDSARTQKNGGCGIGLSAAKAIAEAHKGSITAEYGEKNTITFTAKISTAVKKQKKDKPAN